MAVVAFVLAGVFTGSQESFSQGKAASVNGEVITVRDVESRLRGEGEKLRSFLVPYILNQLIAQELLFQSMKKSHWFVADSEVRHYIEQIPAFQGAKGFEVLRYESFLRNSRTTGGVFEDSIRKEILFQNISGVFSGSMRPFSSQQSFQEQLESIKVNIHYLKFQKKDLSQDEAQAEKVLSSLRGWVENNKASLVLKALKKKKWDKTGEVSLGNLSSSSLGRYPKIIDETLKKKSLKKLYPQLMESQGFYFVLKLASFNTAKKKKTSESRGNNRGPLVLQNYINLERKMAKVKINPRYQKSSPFPFR